MAQEREFTVSVWGGWNHCTLSSYVVRGAAAARALDKAMALFRLEHGTDRVDSAWVLRSNLVSLPEDE
jgi:hypothetical protein